MDAQAVLDKIKQTGVVAVVRAQSAADAVRISKECAQGGIDSIEITYTTPGAGDAIRALAKDPGLLVGAGTVLDIDTAQDAISAGAQFIVSPHCDPAIISYCTAQGIPAIAGVMTVTEAVQALRAGCKLLKLFPADSLGPGFIKALHGPLPGVLVLPTGGITVENAGDFIRAGAVAVGAGGNLTRGDIAENARELVRAVKRAKEGIA
jgi:2-dehydro-3-deoxyphosphogluconate aldolase/(4S)-4-hydroxy-2-oxoglutarate aldolase